MSIPSGCCLDVSIVSLLGVSLIRIRSWIELPIGLVKGGIA